MLTAAAVIVASAGGYAFGNDFFRVQNQAQAAASDTPQQLEELISEPTLGIDSGLEIGGGS